MAKYAISIPQTQKAALYIRVSTDMQADKDSLPLQESDLRKLADLNGINDTKYFVMPAFPARISTALPSGR